MKIYKIMEENALQAGASIYEHGIYVYGFKCGQKFTEIEYHKKHGKLCNIKPKKSKRNKKN